MNTGPGEPIQVCVISKKGERDRCRCGKLQPYAYSEVFLGPSHADYRHTWKCECGSLWQWRETKPLRRPAHSPV